MQSGKSVFLISSKNYSFVQFFIYVIDMSLCLLSLSKGVFLVQYTRLWSDTPNSIIPRWLTFWEELVKTWSMRLAVLLVTLVGIKTSCSREKEKQKSDNLLLEAASFGHFFYNFRCKKFLSHQGVDITPVYLKPQFLWKN